MVLERSEDEVLKYSDDFAKTPDALLNIACQMQMDGLIGKRVGSPAVSRRCSDWTKLKCKRRQGFVIVGYTEIRPWVLERKNWLFAVWCAMGEWQSLIF